MGGGLCYDADRRALARKAERGRAGRIAQMAEEERAREANERRRKAEVEQAGWEWH